MPDLLDSRVREFIDELRSEALAPGSGAAAAVAAAFAASILEKCARATQGGTLRGAVAQAGALRRRVAPLAELDATVYAESLAALHLPERLESEVRNMAIRDTLARAAAVPLAIAEASADIAVLAIEVSERCEPALRADAVAAAQLAEGAARAAAELVAVNLGVLEEDERLELARELAGSAAAAARRVGVFGG